MSQPASIQMKPDAEAAFHRRNMGKNEGLAHYVDRVMPGADEEAQQQFADRVYRLLREYPNER